MSSVWNGANIPFSLYEHSNYGGRCISSETSIGKLSNSPYNFDNTVSSVKIGELC